MIGYPAIESLCGSIPRYSIPAMSGTFPVVKSPFGGAGTPLFYGKTAEPDRLQAEGLALSNERIIIPNRKRNEDDALI